MTSELPPRDQAIIPHLKCEEITPMQGNVDMTNEITPMQGNVAMTDWEIADQIEAKFGGRDNAV